MKYIFTSQPASAKIAASEYKKEDTTSVFLDWLDPGVGLIQSDLDNAQMVQLIKTTPIIFTRHLFEVDVEFDRPETIEELVSLCEGYALSVLNTEGSYSIQARTLDVEIMKQYRNDFRDQLATCLSAQGFMEDIKHGEQILSFFLTKKKVYVGCGTSSMNLSNWNGGMMHCAKEGMISRAEFKLLEAFECFDLDLSKMGTAADLGAAPGGWTNALLNKGFKVTAIDPANMDSELLKNPKLKHYKEMTQTYLTRGLDTHFDLIVNDMKMDVVQSASITNEFEHVLSENGLIIMTFKLPNKFTYLNIKLGIEELSKCYDFVTARQLFHNRSEITVLFKKRK